MLTSFSHDFLPFITSLDQKKMRILKLIIVLAFVIFVHVTSLSQIKPFGVDIFM